MQGNMFKELAGRQVSGSRLPDLNCQAALSRHVVQLQEHELVYTEGCLFDKAFACAWLNDWQVLLGTKCNKLLLVDVNYSASKRIDASPSRGLGYPQVGTGEVEMAFSRSSEGSAAALSQTRSNPQTIALPPVDRSLRSSRGPIQSPGSYYVRPSAVQHALWDVSSQLQSRRESNSSGSAAEDEGDLIASMIQRAMEGDPTSAVPGVGAGESQSSLRQIHAPTSPARLVQPPNCGMHCISVSPCRSMVACGGDNPADCQIFLTETTPCGAKLTPLQTLVGHEDWLFGCAWVTDQHLVTGSRDTSLKLWHIKPEIGKIQTEPLCTRFGKKERVREVAWMGCQQRIASLVIDGTVQFWDAHLNLVSTVSTPYDREVVCMASSERQPLVAVGSQNHVSLVDPRQKSLAASFANADHLHGVRSLAFNRHLLSVGGGQGKIHFWDMRKAGYLKADCLGLSQQAAASAANFHLQSGSGHLVSNDIYRQHFEGMSVHNACYSQAWDAGGTRLLAAGGPLACGLTGHYSAIWD